MPTLNDVLVGHPSLAATDVDWLHLLVGDWQILSDLSFADLVLWVRGTTLAADGWVAAMHVRPNTGPLVFFDDIVGSVAGAGRQALLDLCASRARVIRDQGLQWRDDAPVREDAIPVVRAGRVLAVITRHSNLAAMRSPSRLELTYRGIADTLARMIASGEFPTLGAPTGLRRGAPRVGDGVLRLDVEGVVMYASPNAISALHRLGHHGDIDGVSLSEVTTALIPDYTQVDEALAVVVTGRAPWRTEVESRFATLSLRAIPLTEGGARIGALVLVRDVSELRRRERELLTKDATIREIHHRVKNNLQTVAALLRLQSRRVADEHARSALQEAERRVATIALVHDTLSRTLDEVVDFDEIVARALNAVVEVANQDDDISWRRTGRFGHLTPDDATSMAMIVTELVHNAVEHGLRPGGGVVTVDAHRERHGDDDYLTVVVGDDGAGLPADFRPGGSGLGTQIVSALVQDLRGEITWRAREPRGTEARLQARLRRLPATGGWRDSAAGGLRDPATGGLRDPGSAGWRDQ
ncbi:MAG: PAS domain-containing sensor histidine kinase [Austwickia sp.]|nr:PAS domain-containing sensor histidine kinase [Actinomycetota bacterium]MCB1252561.1 histidine kinase N-terminal domain-containing protein [Austwickia sp.]MCO5125850.1 PAS domain-containing sensor histidine kinase [Paracoccaceae bacterium]MCO5311263.1 PAS domain-containing sensor histidine kinase [Austwickia sp.]